MKKRSKKFKFRKVHRDYRGKSSHNYSRKHQADTSHAPILDDSDISAPAIIIYRSEFDYLSKCILDYLNEETGGQMFGFYTEKGVFVVVYVIGPGPQANHQEAFFNQDEKYLLKVYHVLHKHGLQKIGEWHSHHKLGLDRPSTRDNISVVSVMREHQMNSHILCIGNVDYKDNSTQNAFVFCKDNDYLTQHVAWKVIEMESPYRPLIDNCSELAGVLCHPRTREACHGHNYLEMDSSTKPDYRDDYWLYSKANNLVLKQIIDYLTNLGEGWGVIPMVDNNGIVHLTVRRGEERMEIIFGRNFPHEAPLISFSDGSDMVPEWDYNGSIYDSFVDCYNKFALAIDNNQNMYNF